MFRLESDPAPTTHVLRNGLRIVTTTMPTARTLSVVLALRAGSIYDPPAAPGLAHFLEHLIFKSTADYTRHDLASAMQKLGNRFDPSTNKELISIAGTVPARRADDTLRLIASVAQRPRFDPADFETERKVVLEELRNWEEDPSKRIEVLTDRTLWGAHPLGRDIGGTRSSVRDITRRQVRRYHRRYFHPRNAVLSMAGPLSTREMLDGARRHFGGWRPSRAATLPRRPSVAGFEPVLHRGRRSRMLRRANSQQVWLAVSTTTPSYQSGYEAVLRAQLAQVLVGDGDGSRLWDGMRERLGLAYEVYATMDFYADIGVMSAMSAVNRGRAATALREMRRILEQTRRGFTREEFERGKTALAAQIELYADWNAANASRYADLMQFGQPLVTPAQEIAMLDQVQPREFNRFVKEHIHWESAAVCAIGDGSALDAMAA